MPISEFRERELPRWAQVAAGLLLGVLVLGCGYASATMMFDVSRRAPFLIISIGVILLLGCIWALGKCVRLVIGHRSQRGLMSPRALRVVATLLLVLPIAGLFTGYYREMGAVAIFQAVIYLFGFFKFRALAREREAGALASRKSLDEMDRPT